MSRIAFMVSVFLVFSGMAFAKAPSKTSHVVKDLAGFRLLSVERGSIYDKLGFKKNDVITAVDGQQMDQVEELESRLAGEKKEMAVEVIRDGKPEIFTFTMK